MGFLRRQNLSCYEKPPPRSCRKDAAMVTAPMSEMPDIVIRSRNARACAAMELPTSYGKQLIALPDPMEDEKDAKIWWFSDGEAAAGWIRLKARELSREGVDIIVSAHHIGKELADVLDTRTAPPAKNYRPDAVEQMLQW